MKFYNFKTKLKGKKFQDIDSKRFRCFERRQRNPKDFEKTFGKEQRNKIIDSYCQPKS